MSVLASDDLIVFWFSERVSKLWYNSNLAFDNEVEEKFSSMYQAACDGNLDSWKSTANGCLALILLFDQYPLNVFRNDQQSFATEKQAIQIAEHCINQGLDVQLTNTQRNFMYMPFMHSEDIKLQQKSLDLFKELNPDDTKFAIHHYNIIKKYGRFPHRNKILRRVNTSDEEYYLSTKEAFTG